MPKFPLGAHDYNPYFCYNTAMGRYDVTCVCGWKGYADTEKECEEAHNAHVAENKAPSDA